MGNQLLMQASQFFFREIREQFWMIPSNILMTNRTCRGFENRNKDFNILFLFYNDSRNFILSI